MNSRRDTFLPARRLPDKRPTAGGSGSDSCRKGVNDYTRQLAWPSAGECVLQVKDTIRFAWNAGPDSAATCGERSHRRLGVYAVQNSCSATVEICAEAAGRGVVRLDGCGPALGSTTRHAKREHVRCFGEVIVHDGSKVVVVERCDSTKPTWTRRLDSGGSLVRPSW